MPRRHGSCPLPDEARWRPGPRRSCDHPKARLVERSRVGFDGALGPERLLLEHASAVGVEANHALPAPGVQPHRAHGGWLNQLDDGAHSALRLLRFSLRSSISRDTRRARLFLLSTNVSIDLVIARRAKEARKKSWRAN